MVYYKVYVFGEPVETFADSEEDAAIEYAKENHCDSVVRCEKSGTYKSQQQIWPTVGEIHSGHSN